jgi:acetyl-CoA carboxylase carboxyltransferase component
MGMDKEIEKLNRTEEEARLGAGTKAIERQHKAGKLTARERVDLFFDQGTFVELNMFAQHQCHEFGMQEKQPLGDAVITGYGKVHGRVVYLYAQDFTVLGGSVGAAHAEKICNLMRMARRAKAPIVGLIDSSGARIQEGMIGTYSRLFSENILTSGVVPQISAAMGYCVGGGAYSPALTDFIFMVEGTSQMFITGPGVIKTATGEEIGMQDLGGAKPHSELSGVCDIVAKNDEECLNMIKALLSFLPSSYCEKPPRVDTGDDPSRRDERLLDIVPVDPKRPYDMYDVISRIVDKGEFFEVKANFARNIITGFARLDGRAVGIVANQPLVKAGSLDCDASDKAARFYRTCDCFNVPIVTLVDVPGYLPGVQQEHQGIIRHGAKMLYGFKEATVPKISCVIRKAYGGSYFAMGSKTMGADIALSWPSAEIAVMGAEGAVGVLYKKELEQAKDKEQFRQQKMEEYRSTFSTPYFSATKQVVDIIIRPQETRLHLIKALELLENKMEQIPERKHGNIPL